jgi:predicted NAD-dependent protein-ADP-ribosyltransferase YbiA (DUF1768 family)
MPVAAADIRSRDQLLELIADGGQPKYLPFWGHRPLPNGQIGKGCLSQWWPVSFTVNGEAYASAEHYMMAAKALLFDDTEMAKRANAAGSLWRSGGRGRSGSGGLSGVPRG